ncbi:unnamed protein product [Prorocentrum cordatum]|uniref:Uncharacterized protein n=1 Tax=Prorocentrum cordatum TaxID=2364126 RepID=A0ABN9T6W2_9DINO|nr:unnamed protein product [Polarella glacialis]
MRFTTLTLEGNGRTHTAQGDPDHSMRACSFAPLHPSSSIFLFRARVSCGGPAGSAWRGPAASALLLILGAADQVRFGSVAGDSFSLRCSLALSPPLPHPSLGCDSWDWRPPPLVPPALLSPRSTSAEGCRLQHSLTSLQCRIARAAAMLGRWMLGAQGRAGTHARVRADILPQWIPPRRGQADPRSATAAAARWPRLHRWKLTELCVFGGPRRPHALAPRPPPLVAPLRRRSAPRGLASRSGLCGVRAALLARAVSGPWAPRRVHAWSNERAEVALHNSLHSSRASSEGAELSLHNLLVSECFNLWLVSCAQGRISCHTSLLRPVQVPVGRSVKLIQANRQTWFMAKHTNTVQFRRVSVAYGPLRHSPQQSYAGSPVQGCPSSQ